VSFTPGPRGAPLRYHRRGVTVDGRRVSLVAVALSFFAAVGCGSASLTAGGSDGAAGSTAGAGVADAAGAVGTDASADDAPATGGAAGEALDGGVAGSAGAPDASDVGPADVSADASIDGGLDDAPPPLYDGPAVKVINSSNWNETTIHPFATRRMLVRDEGDPHLVLLDFAQTNPVVWRTVTEGPWARGEQLIGNDQVLGSTSTGYQVFDLRTGNIVKSVNRFGNTQGAYRMASGETMLTRSGATLAFLDKNDQVAHTISYPGFGYVRLARPTRNGTFLVPSDTKLFEGDVNGNVLWTAQGAQWGHAFLALLTSNGDALVSTFFGASLDVVNKTTHLVTKRYGTTTMPNAAFFRPNVFAEFQILPNGNLITSNWQGYGGGNFGIQIIEFTPAGDVAWYYKQDPVVFSSIQGVQVIDGMDPQFLHVQETSSDSTWQPVFPTP
jgi:hypothetical protein